jgi:hypothetical protein
MEITAKEAKGIERLRKQIRLWPRTRWVVAYNGVLLAAVCASSMWFVLGQLREQHRLEHRVFSSVESVSAESWQSEAQSLWRSISDAAEEQDNLLLFSVFCCGWTVLALFAIWNFAILFLYWNGHTEKTFLLKLYDEATRQQNEPAKSAGAVTLPKTSQADAIRGS